MFNKLHRVIVNDTVKHSYNNKSISFTKQAKCACVYVTYKMHRQDKTKTEKD